MINSGFRIKMHEAAYSKNAISFIDVDTLAQLNLAHAQDLCCQNMRTRQEMSTHSTFSIPGASLLVDW